MPTTKSYRAKVTVEQGEAYVVAPIYFWENLVSIYNDYASKAKTKDDKETWLEAADFVERWLRETALEESSDEEWSDY